MNFIVWEPYPSLLFCIDGQIVMDIQNNRQIDDLQEILRQHPYEQEIKDLKYPEQQQQTSSPIAPVEFNKDQYFWVETFEHLQQMAQDLENQSCLAIDLEHHSYRSYQGFVCLMQISTRTQDYVVDCLKLREHLHVLNDSFTDPSIVKVLHGAESDVIWLQRDFGVYIVNMFDTYFASKALEFPSHSLAYLLKEYCNVVADKAYQLADWRIR